MLQTLNCFLRSYIERDISSECKSAIRSVVLHKLTYLNYAKLHTLAKLAQSAQGPIVEAGCALGGSSIVLCSAKSQKIPLWIYDTFGMIPSPSENDEQDAHARYAIIRNGNSIGIRGDPYYGYRDNLYDQVKASFSRLGYPIEEHNVQLCKGLIQDTLYINEPVALAHIDVDWYESVKTCLERIVPYLLPNGFIVIDDYGAYSGCKKAVDEYFDGMDYIFLNGASLVIRKNCRVA